MKIMAFCTRRQGIGGKPNPPRRDQIIKQQSSSDGGGWDEVGFSLAHYGGCAHIC